MFEYYEDLPLGFATIPTRLYRLEPIGIGTPLVESLSSYVQRLADAHAVSASHLVKYEINPLLKFGQLRPENSSVGARSKIMMICGLSRIAHEWVNAIESLTFVNGLRFLTLLPFEHLFQEKGLFDRPTDWCSKCIEEWTRQGKPIYWPLIWRMLPVKICPVHLTPLESKCVNCSGASAPLRPFSTPGYCPSCGRWFGSSAYYQQELHGDKYYNFWAARNVSELLAAGPNIAKQDGRTAVVSEWLEYIIRTGIKRVGIRSLARAFSVRSVQLEAWLEGRQRPKLGELLYICWFLRLSLLEVTTKKLNGDNDTALLNDLLMERMDESLENVASVNWVSLSAFLKDIANDKAALMRIPDIAKVYKCSVMTLHKRYPEICKEISAKMKQKLADKRSIKKARTRARKKVLVAECVENGGRS